MYKATYKCLDTKKEHSLHNESPNEWQLSADETQQLKKKSLCENDYLLGYDIV